MMSDHVDNTVNFANPTDSTRTYQAVAKDNRPERLIDGNSNQAKSTKDMANDEFPFNKVDLNPGEKASYWPADIIESNRKFSIYSMKNDSCTKRSIQLRVY